MVVTTEVELDRDLVERARKADREAFAVLVHQVSDSLYAVAHRILRDTGLAEDALQNALVIAWRRLPHLREPDRFEAWIHRILVHACYDESQRARHWTANVRVLPARAGREFAQPRPPVRPVDAALAQTKPPRRKRVGRRGSGTARAWRADRVMTASGAFMMFALVGAVMLFRAAPGPGPAESP